jgi:hypothetical protein
MKNIIKNLALDYLRGFVTMIMILWTIFFLIGAIGLIASLSIEEYISSKAAIILSICWFLHLPLGLLYTSKIMNGKFVNNN